MDYCADCGRLLLTDRCGKRCEPCYREHVKEGMKRVNKARKAKGGKP